jgi:hypothetical protein
MYKLTNTTSIIRTTDNASIPADTANTDYQSYLAWLAEGNTPEPADVYVPTLADLAEAVRLALQAAIDDKAKTFGFISGGNALMLYAGFVNPFQPLAQTFATWEASVWYEAELYKAEVFAGTKPMLSPAEAVALMPSYPA